MLIRVKALPASQNHPSRYRVSYRQYQRTWTQQRFGYKPEAAAAKLCEEMKLHGEWRAVEVDRGPVRFYACVTKAPTVFTVAPQESIRDYDRDWKQQVVVSFEGEK